MSAAIPTFKSISGAAANGAISGTIGYSAGAATTCAGADITTALA